MPALTFGSLFSGFGGLDLGLERAGLQCAWQVEINAYARQVLKKQWSHVTRFQDIRSCGAWNLYPVDVLAGGFPCQDISLSGPGGGVGRRTKRIVERVLPDHLRATTPIHPRGKRRSFALPGSMANTRRFGRKRV